MEAPALQPQLRSIVAGIKQSYLRDLIENIFLDFDRILGYLDQVRDLLHQTDSTDQALVLFEAIRSESFAAAAYVEQQRTSLNLAFELSEEMERIGFAIGYEVKAAYSRILACELEDEVRCAIEDAHELLRNCFQELTTMLAQVFDSTLKRANLFDEVRERREHSRELYDDLSALLRAARHAESVQDDISLELFFARFEHLCTGSIRHLMQKDRETCQGFGEDFETARKFNGLKFFLHRFVCYLEILIKHVGMRSVLSEDVLVAAA
jgi:superfamily I DNA/RNA helicase